VGPPLGLSTRQRSQDLPASESSRIVTFFRDVRYICKVYEVGLAESKPYIAMQLVIGLPLDLASRAMTLPDKVQVMKDVAEAMHAAHEQGIIHRDLKPSSVAPE
jgi:serine/threonine protein kinase